MSEIQQKIRDYLRGAGPISDFTLCCFVGMVETGEATYADFSEVGGEDLVNNVRGYERVLATKSVRRVWRLGQTEGEVSK